MEERSGITSFKGNPVILLGPELKVGDKAPDFSLVDNSLTPVTLADFKGKTKIISTVPDKVAVLTVSLDLPFAQKRWCGAAGIDRVTTLSDYQEHSFGLAYGVLIKELKLLSRSIFVLDGDDTIRYIQHVPEITTEPDYSAVLEAAKVPQIAIQQVPMDGVCGGY